MMFFGKKAYKMVVFQGYYRIENAWKNDWVAFINTNIHKPQDGR